MNRASALRQLLLDFPSLTRPQAVAILQVAEWDYHTAAAFLKGKQNAKR